MELPRPLRSRGPSAAAGGEAMVAANIYGTGNHGQSTRGGPPASQETNYDRPVRTGTIFCNIFSPLPDE
jgi:hypothetical protein